MYRYSAFLHLYHLTIYKYHLFFHAKSVMPLIHERNQVSGLAPCQVTMLIPLKVKPMWPCMQWVDWQLVLEQCIFSFREKLDVLFCFCLFVCYGHSLLYGTVFFCVDFVVVGFVPFVFSTC